MILEGSSKRTTIGITLFEEQLVRSYLLSDNFRLIELLAKNHKVVVLCSLEISILLKKVIPDSLLESICINSVSKYEETSLQRVTGFLLRQAESGPTPKLKAQAARDRKQISGFGKVLRIIANIVFSNSISVRILRNVYYLLHDRKRFFVSNNELEKIDILFATSLTNFSADTAVALSIKKINRPIIGTVRSWDNLVTHGSLRFIPDTFVSHSPFLTNCAMNSQFMRQSQLISLTTPSYRRIFLPQREVKENRVIYGCMGPNANPDEAHAISWLIENWNDYFRDLELLILEHPAFPLRFRPSQLSKNIKLISLPYHESSLIDYYKLLGSARLVLAGGTTVLLDAAFAGTEIAAICFDFEKQLESLSALRYFDARPHTMEFFERCNVRKLYSLEELIDQIRASTLDDFLNPFLPNLPYFTGNIDSDFCEAIKDIIEKLLHTKVELQ